MGSLLDLAIAQNRLEEGEAVLARLAERFPADPRLLGARVSLLLQAGKPQRAMDLIRLHLTRSRADDDFLEAALAVRRMLPASDKSTSKDPADRICLCMIVKNEALNLARCLHAGLDIADQIVVVDTGSDDETETIARIFGARVYNFKWSDDFAAARNFGLQKADCPWILVLDADELIDPRERSSIGKLVSRARSRNLAYSLMTRNYTPLANVVGWTANDGRYPGYEAGCGWFPSWKVRLFRKAPGIKFRYPVHERVDPSLQEAGVTIERARVVIHHYGNLDLARSKTKAVKYYHLAMAKLEKLRHDPWALRELAIQAGQLERWQEAVVLWENFLAIAPQWPEAYVNLAGAHWQLGNYAQTVDLAGKALELDGESKEAFLNQAMGLLMQGKVGKALAILESLLKKCPDYLAAQFQQAVCLAAEGRKEEAGRAAARLVERVGQKVWKAAVGEFGQRLRGAGLEKMALEIESLEGHEKADVGEGLGHENRSGQFSGMPA